MLLGKVIGTLTPCVVYKGLEGVPLLWVQPLDKQGSPKGEPLVACDATRAAGPGEFIYFEGGREAARTNRVLAELIYPAGTAASLPGSRPRNNSAACARALANNATPFSAARLRRCPSMTGSFQRPTRPKAAIPLGRSNWLSGRAS